MIKKKISLRGECQRIEKNHLLKKYSENNIPKKMRTANAKALRQGHP